MIFNDPNTNFKVTPLFDADCLRNGMRYLQCNTNRDLHNAVLKGVISNELE